MTPRLRGALEQGVGALEALGLRYAVVGGLAVGAWASPRATRDVDLYADLPDSVRPALEKELASRGFHVPAMEAELEQFGVFRSRSKAGVFLDVFSAAGPLGEAILQNRARASIGGKDYWFVSANELAVLKAFSDRERDFDDLVALLRGGAVDAGDVKRWARDLDAGTGTNEVSERLERALATAGRRA